jgi:hypothetical protein
MWLQGPYLKLPCSGDRGFRKPRRKRLFTGLGFPPSLGQSTTAEDAKILDSDIISRNVDSELAVQGTLATPKLVGTNPKETRAEIFGTRPTIGGASVFSSIKVSDILETRPTVNGTSGISFIKVSGASRTRSNLDLIMELGLRGPSE